MPRPAVSGLLAPLTDRHIRAVGAAARTAHGVGAGAGYGAAVIRSVEPAVPAGRMGRGEQPGFVLSGVGGELRPWRAGDEGVLVEAAA